MTLLLGIIRKEESQHLEGENNGYSTEVFASELWGQSEGLRAPKLQVGLILLWKETLFFQGDLF